MEGGSRRAIFAAFLANLGIAIAKLVAFAFTGAASMLAEAIHSFADTGNQGLLFLGGRRARREPDAQHPFGFVRERYFWAFVVSVMLFSLGGAFSIWEGVRKYLHGAVHDGSAAWAYGVLAGGFRPGTVPEIGLHHGDAARELGGRDGEASYGRLVPLDAPLHDLIRKHREEEHCHAEL